MMVKNTDARKTGAGKRGEREWGSFKTGQIGSEAETGIAVVDDQAEPIEQPKKKLSTGAILGGGAAILALGGAGLGIALKKRRGKYEVS